MFRWAICRLVTVIFQHVSEVADVFKLAEESNYMDIDALGNWVMAAPISLSRRRSNRKLILISKNI